MSSHTRGPLARAGCAGAALLTATAAPAAWKEGLALSSYCMGLFCLRDADVTVMLWRQRAGTARRSRQRLRHGCPAAIAAPRLHGHHLIGSGATPCRGRCSGRLDNVELADQTSQLVHVLLE